MEEKNTFQKEQYEEVKIEEIFSETEDIIAASGPDYPFDTGDPNSLIPDWY